MIIKKTVTVGEAKIEYEVVIRNELVVEEKAPAHNYALIVHDPDLAGGRREGFLCPQDQVPMNHVQVGILAFK